ncbi:MAG: SLBB domain-containing protein [Nitrospirota bacterium]
MRRPIYISLLIFFLFRGILFAQDYILGPRDLLKITVYDHPDLSITVRVSEDGRITFPLLGEISVGDLTVQNLEKKLTLLLSDGYLIKPQVIIFVEEYRVVVYVTGEVKRPGSYPYEDNMAAIKAITLAGGLTDNADEKGIKILRKRGGGEISYYASFEEQIMPNDVIVVSKKLFYFVTGEVKNTGSYPFKEGTTMIKAISIAGGFTDKADRSKLEIRRVKDEKEITIYGQMKDKIMADDVLVIHGKSYFFITGEVKKPGSYQYEEGITVLKAVSMAGGFTDKASPRRAKTIRRDRDKDIELKVEMDDEISPDDVIVIPESFF